MNQKNSANNDKNLAIIGMMTAVAASLCCISPIIGAIIGIGSIASTFSWLEPYRPYLIILTVIVLGFAWYRSFKRKINHETDCNCNKLSFFKTKTFLGMITLFSVILFLFPYYFQTFLQSTEKKINTIQGKHLYKVKIKVIGMTCPGCEYSVNKIIKKLPGVYKVTSNHKIGSIIIKYDKNKVTLKDFKNAINSLGYTITNIIGKI